MSVIVEIDGCICTIYINRPDVKNAVDLETARQLANAFRDFENNDLLSVAVLAGAGETFCAGADLKALADGKGNVLNADMKKDGPMGPTRMALKKPVIAAIAGHAVAGGLELACWCDMRIMEEDAIVGVFCRRFGVPLIDGGTQRLPRLIGLSRALDLILTGRPVDAEEAYQIGLANRVVAKGRALEEAKKLASAIAAFPQVCMLNDREAVYKGIDLDFDKAMQLEFQLGLETINTGETFSGAKHFANGYGRHGEF